MGRKIIGLTGAFGSGSSFLAEHFFEKDGFMRCSLSDALRIKYREKYGEDDAKRETLQAFGNELRETDPAILSKEVDKVIKENKGSDIVIESIRNPAEINYFRENYSEFVLIGIFAEYDVRWERVKGTYEGSKDAFDVDEKRDQGNQI